VLVPRRGMIPYSYRRLDRQMGGPFPQKRRSLTRAPARQLHPQEFIARVRAVLRRPRLLVSSVLSLGNVELHVGTNEVVVADNKVLLRRREALILGALLMRRDRVITRTALIDEIYGFDDEIASNTLEAQVSRLRKKLAELGGDVEIRSMRGIGYILRMAQKR
jgi:two-component system, OmpR family, response regulator